MAVCLWAVASPAAPIDPDEASKHVAQTATACGGGASTKMMPTCVRQPTFLDFGKPYPDQIFTAVIFGRDRRKFGTPKTSFREKRVCVTGRVRNYPGKPEIIRSDPSQLAQ
jgi:hypothetical protein